MDDEEGIPATTGWLPYRAVWNYHASFAAHVWLYAGRPDKAVDYLYAFANHAAPTWVWREEQSLKSSHNGQLIGDMPHNWASAEFIRLVRHLIVFERGETLDLLAGLPPEWMFPGAVTELAQTPTRFGPVSIRVAVGENGQFTVTFVRDTSRPRQPTGVRMRLPAGTSVTVNGAVQVVPADGWLALPLAAKVEVVGEWAQISLVHL